MEKQLLIIFARNPELGKVKTRLAETIGDEAALNIYVQLLEKTVSITENLSVHKVVYYDERIGTGDLWDSSKYFKALQNTRNLGEKMHSAVSNAFEEGYEKVCIIGSDCYDLTQEIIENAFESLNSKQAVIGAAEDGGYYLLGMSQFVPELFEDKAWSTDSVFSSTKKDFERLGLSFDELQMLKDIDIEADLGSWVQVYNTTDIAN